MPLNKPNHWGLPSLVFGHNIEVTYGNCDQYSGSLLPC